jgi:4a-hydroxytetrahydrobiopterin dehydratase
VAAPAPLAPAARTALLEAHPDWTLDGSTLRRTFVFGDFAEAMGFVVRVGLAAEAADHHPDIDVRWNRVALAITTHSVGSLTDLDRALVERIDGFPAPGVTSPGAR